MTKINAEIAEVNEKLQILYNDRLNKVIEESDFLLFSDGLKNQRDKLVAIKQDIQEQLNEFEKVDVTNRIEQRMKEMMEDLVNGGDFTKENLIQLVRRIEIDKDKNINIQYNFLELNCIGEKNEYEKTGS